MSKKHNEYAALLTAKIGELFDDANEICIDKEELKQGDNLTDFFHALANVMPCVIFESFTGESKNILEFNHIANRLCFQYMNKDNAEKQETK